ncbi:CDP-glycerol glycerophosphotransferase family protein [Candidatus Woesearchaeota archaeon]|nr:CDP-glycerol glycerophosphotransferase family protein [Candidatus Woesearchaeota archaeon]
MKLAIVENGGEIKGCEVFSINNIKKQFDSDRAAVDWIKKLSSFEVEGKNIKEILTFEDISIWWWMESWLYYSYVFENPIRDVIRVFDLVNYIISEKKPESIIVIKDKSLLQKLVLLIANEKGIPVEFKRRLNTKRVREAILKRMRFAAMGLYLSMKPVLRKTYWRFIKKIDKKQNKILFFTFMPYQKTKNKKGEVVFKDKYLEDIYSFLKKDSIVVDGPHMLGLELKKLKQKVERDPEIMDCFESYRRFKDYYHSLKQKRFLLKKFKNLIKNEEFKHSFFYNGADIYKLVLPQFRRYFKSRLKYHLLDYYTLKNMIDELEPSLVLSHTETDVNMMQFFSICYKKNIPTLGIQHGTVGYHTSFVHTKGEVSKDLNCLSPYCPLPTKTALWGDSTKDFFLKFGNYPEDGLVVTGNPRYDILSRKDRIYDKQKIKKKYGIDSEKKIVLLCTNKIPNLHVRIEILKNMCLVAKKMNLFLIIKPHPGEYSTKLHNEIARKYLDDYIIAKGADTFELLYLCDLLITPMSTVIYEAMIFEKPTILVNFSALKDYIDFSSEKALILVNDVKLLEKYISKIFNDKVYFRKLKGYMKDFQYRSTYKNDGNASLRIAKLINKIKNG